MSLNAWNFTLFSPHATGAVLLLYGDDVVKPAHQLELDPVQNQGGAIWHCSVPETAAPGTKYYAWRTEGSHEPAWE